MAFRLLSRPCRSPRTAAPPCRQPPPPAREATGLQHRQCEIRPAPHSTTRRRPAPIRPGPPPRRARVDLSLAAAVSSPWCPLANGSLTRFEIKPPHGVAARRSRNIFTPPHLL